LAEFDAILVQGGGVRDQGELPDWSRRRFDRVIELHNGEYVISLSAGTLHKPPPLDVEGFPIVESVAGAGYLIKGGISADLLLPETCSYDTIGTAYFSRVIHVDQRGFRRLLVVTSAFHMPRTEAIFRWVYGLAPHRYELRFEQVDDVGIAEEALRARRSKEREGLESVKLLSTKIVSMPQLHRWLFTEHDAYAVRADNKTTQTGYDDALSTY
jgi:hypothetical protein